MPAEQNAMNELEGVVALAELVQYQPGAVVSRTIVKKAAAQKRDWESFKLSTFSPARD
jgi:hypothetical protein